jgi:hypothetical protein
MVAGYRQEQLTFSNVAMLESGRRCSARWPEIAIRKMDWLREIISESVSVPAGKRSANGAKTSAGAAPAQPLQG